MRKILTMILITLPALAFSQDRDGNDTPGEWVIDHHRAFGLWDSMCDHRVTGDAREERCYLRYVDVFSGRPNFAAQFFFLTPGPRVEFGMEAGTLFDLDGFRILQNNLVTWDAAQPSCLVGLACNYEAESANALLAQMAKGTEFAFDFIDRHGTRQSLRWDLTPFPDALKDFESQSADRGL